MTSMQFCLLRRLNWCGDLETKRAIRRLEGIEEGILLRLCSNSNPNAVIYKKMLLRVRCGCNRRSSVFPAKKCNQNFDADVDVPIYTAQCVLVYIGLFVHSRVLTFDIFVDGTHNSHQQRCGPLSITNSRQSCCHLAHHCLPINFACRCRHPNPENYRHRQIIILFIK